MDFLGLKTLTVIDDAQNHVRQTQNRPEFDVEAAALTDQATFDLLNSGRTTGVFQLESGGMQQLCRQIGLSSFEEIIALIALYRPGPMQFIPQFIEGKKDPSTVVVPHPLLKELVEETYGVLVYQEQVMQSAQIIAGYTLGGADILRRAMGKKIQSVMEAQKEVFVKGAQATNQIDRQTAESIFALLEKFAQYGFNKSHSAAYAMLSYRTAYLKANFPVEFMAAVLTSEQGNADKISHFFGGVQCHKCAGRQSRRQSIWRQLHPIIQGETQSIRFGLGAIKGVGEGAAIVIIDERKQAGDYKDFSDFILRHSDKTINRRVIEALIKTGAFDSLGADRASLLDSIDAEIAEAESARKDLAAGQSSLFDLMDIGQPSSSNKRCQQRTPS